MASCWRCKVQCTDVKKIAMLGEECMDFSPKQTNADRIRAMTDEELAMNMMCPNENGMAEIECDQSDSCNCYECILKWLQSEAAEAKNQDNHNSCTNTECTYWIQEGDCPARNGCGGYQSESDG